MAEKHSIGTKASTIWKKKHENKQSSFHKEIKNNVLVTFTLSFLKALSNFSFPLLKEVLKTNFPKAKRKLLSIGRKQSLLHIKLGWFKTERGRFNTL